jgi:hypothetical protein
LWPRVHEEVVKTLDKKLPSVSERSVLLFPRMKKIQDLVVKLIGDCLTELKAFNRQVGMPLNRK